MAKDAFKNYQLELPEPEMRRLASRIVQDYRSAIGDHERRLRKWAEYERRWRATVDQPEIGDEDKSNFPVPLVQWGLLGKLAKEMDSLLGDDAEITAVPTGPSDYRKVQKISRYMSWRVLHSMKLVNPLCVFITRKLLYGRSFAYAPYKRETYDVNGKEVVDYEGAGFEPLWPDDVIVPAETVQSLHEFSFFIRRYRTTPDALLEGEEQGLYQGVSDNWDTIINSAQSGLQREFEGENIKLEQDEAEGVSYQRPLSSGETITIIEWYGRWRPLKKGQQDAAEYDFSKRERRQSDFVVRFIQDLNLVVGVQDLRKLYPALKSPRPFVESSMLKDGSYWSPGLAELVINLEDELRSNHNQATEAGQLAMQPPIGYRPASGFKAETFKVAPGMCIPLDNPQTDIRQIEIGANMEMASWKEQVCLAYYERLTGMSDMSLGRASDRPNAPRTARQTVALLEEGNVRISLDTKVLREDMNAILKHFWELEWMFSPEQTFFRVTEDDAGGLFPVRDGGAYLTQEDRDGRYDFRLEFASSVYGREADKEKTLARYQLDLQNPLIASNPRALWKVTNDAHAALGDPNFAALVPEPPDDDLPVNPKEEWTRLLQGEDIHVNPMDNDELHLIRHKQDMSASEQDPNQDKDAYRKLVVHYMQHIEQLQQKKIAQALTEQAVSALGQIAAARGAMGQPGQPPGGGGLSGPPAPMQPPNPLAPGAFQLGEQQ